MLFIVLFLSLSSNVYSAPRLLFSDLTSGPATGNGATDMGQPAGVNGAFVTVWGYGLGASQGTSTITISGVTSPIIYTWGNCTSIDKTGETYSNLYDSHKMQWVCFQIPSTASGSSGITVTVDGETSNILPFTIRTGNIYFVDGSAVGAGTGTYTDPWQSPASLVSEISDEDGATCYFREGVYANTEYANIKDSDKALFYSGSAMAGTAAAPNAFSSYPNEVASLEATYGDDKDDAGYFMACFRAYPYFSWKYFTVSKMRLEANTIISRTWTGFRFTGNLCIAGTVHNSGTGHFSCGWKTTSVPDQINGVQLYGNIITGATVADKQDHAIYFGCAKNVAAGWNYVYDNSFEEGPMFSTNVEGSNGVDFWLPVENLHIHDNVIDMSNHPSRGIGFFEMRSGSTAYVYNNIIIGPTFPSSSGIAAYQCSGTVEWYNNTFYNTGYFTGETFSAYSISVPGGNYQPNASFRNNIIYSSTDANYYVGTSGTLDDFTLSNNCYYGIGSFADNSDGAATDADVNSYDGDPLFTLNGSDFTLQTNSPLNPSINPGVDLTSVVDIDFVGAERSIPMTIGAYEFSVGEIPQSSPTKQISIGKLIDLGGAIKLNLGE